MLVIKSFTCRGNSAMIQMQVRMFSRIDGETCERVVISVQNWTGLDKAYNDTARSLSIFSQVSPF